MCHFSRDCPCGSVLMCFHYNQVGHKEGQLSVVEGWNSVCTCSSYFEDYQRTREYGRIPNKGEPSITVSVRGGQSSIRYYRGYVILRFLHVILSVYMFVLVCVSIISSLLLCYCLFYIIEDCYMPFLHAESYEWDTSR